MMFLFHISLALSLIALTLGMFLYGWSCKVEGACKCMGKMIALIIILLAAVSTFCTVLCGINVWRGNPGCMHEMGMHDMQSGSAMTGGDMQKGQAMEKLTKPAKQ